jgi:hypothetical protein
MQWRRKGKSCSLIGALAGRKRGGRKRVARGRRGGKGVASRLGGGRLEREGRCGVKGMMLSHGVEGWAVRGQRGGKGGVAMLVEEKLEREGRSGEQGAGLTPAV